MTPRRPNPKTKQKLLDAAQELFLIKGYGASSVDEICQKAKVTKGSFFHYFKSKEELGKILLERFCCDSQAEMKSCACLKENEPDPLKRVYAHIDYGVEFFKSVEGNRCLLGTMAHELSETHPEIREMCARGFESWAKIFISDLSQAKKKYAPKANFDPKSLADHLIATIEGAQILAKVKHNSKVMEKSLMHFKDYLNYLFNQKQV